MSWTICGRAVQPQFRVWRGSTATVACCHRGSNRSLYYNEFFGFVWYLEGPPAPESGGEYCWGPVSNKPAQMQIVFRRGDTRRVDCGWVKVADHGKHTGYSILNYALGTVTIDGKSYKVFEIQRARSYVYDSNGNRTGGWLDPGMRFATDSDMLGMNYPWLWYVKYYYNKTTGSWLPIIPGKSGGFIDTGLNADNGGSTPTTSYIKTSLA